MKKMTKRMIALSGVLALGLTAAKAQTDGALLDALVKKGVLSDQEPEAVW
jgi:polyhydroxyalkanoate synthesis regulator phasin